MTVTNDRITTEARFSIVPEWILDANVSDRAVRLYAVLARYADTEHTCFPARATLAERLRCSTSSVDRAINELVDADIITVKRRGGEPGTGWTSNLYTLRVSPPVNIAIPTGDDREVAPVNIGRPHQWRTNENHMNENQVNDTRSAFPLLGHKAQTAVAAIKQKGISEEKIQEAVIWLQENNLPIAAFRIQAHIDGKPQPAVNGQPKTLKADERVDWSAEMSETNPLTGETPF